MSPARFHQLRDLTFLHSRRWARRLAFWGGAVVVGLVAVAFARLGDTAGGFQIWIYQHHRWAMLLITPAAAALSVWMVQRYFPGAQGSGIPQVIAAIEREDGEDPKVMRRLLPLRVASGKLVMTIFGVFGGLSIGREGPTVQISATLMSLLGRFMRLSGGWEMRALVVAGGAAGIAAAFNTPLAGVVFAIEELSRTFEARTSGLVLTSVILAGITSLALLGDYSYFGTSSAALSFGAGWLCVIVTGIAGGVFGGGFSQLLIGASEGRIGALLSQKPVRAAAVLGLAVAAIGEAAHGITFGTGYATAKTLVEDGGHTLWYYFPAKFTVTVLSYLSGVPGGIFAPSLSVGAALGELLTHLVPGAPAGVVVLLGMAGYFTGVVQAPITGIVIVMEMTNNQSLLVPLMATSLIAHGTSRLICRKPLYGALAERFRGSPAQLPLPDPPREAE